MKLKILVAVIVGALVVGGGAFALTRLLGPAEDAAISYVPDDAIGYMNVFIRPSNNQKRALDSLLQKFPGIDSTDEAIEKVVELIDQALEQEGMNYEDDVEPWLGDQVALFFVGGGTAELPNFAFLVESKNDGALEDFVESVAAESEVEITEKEYEGETYRMQADEAEEPVAVGVVDGFLVVGSEDAFKAAIDANASGDTLEEDEDFLDATEPLSDDWMGLFYLDTQGFVSELSRAGQFGPNERAAFDAFGLDEQGSQAAILYVSPDAVTLEATGGFSPTGQFAELTESVSQPGIVPELPADTWGAYGVPQFGDLVNGLFDTFQNVPGFDREQVDAMFYGQTGLRLQEDVLSWMEDAGVWVQGTSIQSIAGGLVIESGDPAKTARVLDKLEELVASQGVRPQPESAGGLEGFSVQIPGVPAPVYVFGGERLVIGYGDAAVDAASGEGETLEDSEAFRAAQEAVGEDFNIAFYLDVDGAQEFGEAVASFSGAPMESYEQDVKPYIDVLTHIVTASKMEGDRLVQKFLIGVE